MTYNTNPCAPRVRAELDMDIHTCGCIDILDNIVKHMWYTCMHTHTCIHIWIFVQTDRDSQILRDTYLNTQIHICAGTHMPVHTQSIHGYVHAYVSMHIYNYSTYRYIDRHANCVCMYADMRHTCGICVCIYIYYVLMIFMGFVCIILYIHNCASQTARVVRYCTWLPSQFVPVQPRSHLEALAMLPGLKSFFGESGYLEKLENALSLHCGLED